MNSIDQELFAAARDNNLPEVRRLFRAGADVNAKDSYGGTPLHWTCCRGHVAVTIELLGHGADTEAKDRQSRRPLHFACLNGHLAVVNELRSPNDSDGKTSILSKRRSRGADTEARDFRGETPLHCATSEGHLPVVKALLRGGADCHAISNQGFLPIHSAVSKRRSSGVAKCLLQHIYATIRRLPLHEFLEDLTWIGDPNSNIRNVPPLRGALRKNVLGTDDVVEILEYLVDQNPELLSARDQDGSLSLHLACRRAASFTIVQSLVNRYKASVKCVTSEGDLPLFLACEMPETSLDTIFLLVKLYPDLVYR
jgi:ankyrin repeat protein